ncbi:acyl-CoA synthetase [Alcanivorax sp. ZXX171]|nr:acyl-CoA synthetase [Alcanivorax sp. ZXX171]
MTTNALNQTILAAREQTLSGMLRRTARRTPDRTAIICGEVSWSYRQFDDTCDRLARALLSRGIASGDKVAVLAKNSHGFVAMRLALARVGAVLVPVNFMLNARDMAYILAHSGARTLCTDSTMADTAREAAALDTSVDQFIWLPDEAGSPAVAGMTSFDELIREGADAEPALPRVTGDMLAQIVYTSGTESLPKGAMLSHEAVITQHMSCVMAAGFEPSDVMLHALPLFHCAQLDTFFGTCVYTGITNIITATPTPEVILPALEKHGVTAFFSPPTVWISLLRSPLFDSERLSGLRKGYYGAAIMPVAVLEELLERLPDMRLWNLYGQTEIAPTATILGPEDQIRKAGSAGQPVFNVETRVVDDDEQEVPTGTVGEIVHRSPQLMSGYFNDEERTLQAFRGGWFHSGDLGFFDDEGYLTIVDRKKDMIKTGGENVSSREVEETVFQMDQVSEVAVIASSDPVWVEAVTAIVVLRDGASLSEDMVVTHCRERLAGFKVPKRVIFTDALPRNPSGKILKRDLRELYEPKD